jgi:RNA polymerase sigma factor (sigma-70 family)
MRLRQITRHICGRNVSQEMSVAMAIGETSLSKPFRVVIADGQEIFRNGLRNLLDDLEEFHVIAEVDNESDLLQLLRMHEVDLVLVDVALPNLSGLEWLQSLREMIQLSAVILFSDAVDSDFLSQAFLSGIGGFLTRDLPKKVVIEALRCWQQGLPALTLTTAAVLVQNLVSRYQELEKVVRGLTESRSRQSGTQLLRSTAEIAGQAELQKLTQQESRVFQLMYQGLSNKQIAVRLAISPYTVSKHMQQILRKLGVSNRTQAASYALFKGDGSILDEL